MNIQQIGFINQPQINESRCLFQKNNKKEQNNLAFCLEFYHEWNYWQENMCFMGLPLSLSVSQQVEVSLMEVAETGLAWLTHAAPVEGN